MIIIRIMIMVIITKVLCVIVFILFNHILMSVYPACGAAGVVGSGLGVIPRSYGD